MNCFQDKRVCKPVIQMSADHFVCVLTPVTVLSLKLLWCFQCICCYFLTHWVLFSLLKFLFCLLSFAEGENQGTVWWGDYKQRCVACKYADCSLICTHLSSPSCNIHTLHYLSPPPPPPPPPAPNSHCTYLLRVLLLVVGGYIVRQVFMLQCVRKTHHIVL